jgi:hypothetical protein
MLLLSFSPMRVEARAAHPPLNVLFLKNHILISHAPKQNAKVVDGAGGTHASMHTYCMP